MRELYVDTREGAACFRTISEAVASLPSENEELTVIHVAPGIYEERLTIETPFIVLEGSGAQQTRVTGNLGAYELLEDGTKRGTFRTQTVLVHTHDFTARNITFENTAGPGRSAGQAIALYADGDRLLFENVDLVGFQDAVSVLVQNVGCVSKCNILHIVQSRAEDGPVVVSGNHGRVFLSTETDLLHISYTCVSGGSVRLQYLHYRLLGAHW